jgi:chromosome segregation ATPase
MSEGLQKLAEYLNQTRRQAELSIDSLNERISILSTENKDLQKNLDSLFEERNYYKELAERLQLENSKKWKFQERDDWKSLVDSVQRDRSRLQEENTALTEMLQLEKEKNNILEQEIATLTNKYDNLIQELDAIKVEKENQMSNNHSMDYGLLPVTPVKSKILEDEAMSPRSSVHALKAELEHLTRKVREKLI